MFSSFLRGLSCGMFFLMGCAPFLFASTFYQSAALTIVRGNEVTIKNDRGEQRYLPQASQQNVITLNLNDVVQTGQNTFVDITLDSNGAVIKLAENTSFELSGLYVVQPYYSSYNLLYAIPYDAQYRYNNTSCNFILLYGRILACRGDGKIPLSIQTGSSVTLAEAGDINIDYMILPQNPNSNQPVLSVSALSGSAAILPKYTNPSYGRISLDVGETVLVGSHTNNLERSKTTKAVAEYWDRNYTNLSGANTGLAVRNEQTGEIKVISAQAKSRSGPRTAGIITGVVLVLGGVALQSAMHMMESTQIEKQYADKVFQAGYIPIGLGSVFLISSYLAPDYR